MHVRYISKENVIDANKKATSAYGQPHFVIAEANLEHVLEAVQHYGENISDEDERILRKAAYLLYHLAYDAHVFTDGNKRTALVSTSFFLSINHFAIMFNADNHEAEEERMAKLVKDIAEGKKSISAAHKWLKSVVLPFEESDLEDTG